MRRRDKKVARAALILTPREISHIRAVRCGGSSREMVQLVNAILADRLTSDGA